MHTDIHPSQASPDQLDVRMRRLEALDHTILGNIQTLASQASEEELARWGHIEDRLAEADSTDNMHVILREVKDDSGNSDFECKVAHKLGRLMRVQAAQEETQEQFVPVLRDKLGVAWQQFDATFGYDEAFQDLLDHGDRGKYEVLSQLQGWTRDIKSAQNPGAILNIPAASAALKFLLQHTPEKRTEESELPVPSADTPAEVLTAVEKKLAEGRELAGTYFADEFRLAGIPTTHANFDKLGLYVDSDTSGSGRMRQAATRVAERLLRPGPERQVPEKDARDIPLYGFKQLRSDTIRRINEEYVWGWLDDGFPPAFLHSISSIVRVEPHTLGAAEDSHVSGSYNSETGRIYLAYDIEERDYPANPDYHWKRESTERRLAGGLPTGLGETLSHEVGHNVHTKVLTLEELAEWEEIVANDPVYISGYVEKCDHKDSRALRKREDFAESIRAFRSTPSYLLALSEARFTFMEKIFTKYDTRPEKPVDPKNPMRTWQAGARKARASKGDIENLRSVLAKTD